MGLLKNGKEKTLTYKDSKKYQRFLKQVSALQLTKLLKTYLTFQNTEANRLKFGIEQELHMVTDFEHIRKSEEVDSKAMKKIPKLTTEREYSVFLDRDRYVESIPKPFFESLEFMPEYSSWMIEIVPKAPFEHFLNAKEIQKHLNDVDSLNRLDLDMAAGKNPGKKKACKVLSTTYFPKVGYADFYIRPNGDRIPYAERKEINAFSGSNYFIDETISKHVRFPTLTQNSVLKRGAPVEINIPIFIDFKTQVRFNLYEEPESYSQMAYILEEQLREKLKKEMPAQVVDLLVCLLKSRKKTPFLTTTERSFPRRFPKRI